MAKPINRKQQRNRYILLSIAIYLAILYVACHIGQCTDQPDIYRMFEAGIEHIKGNPLDIFPINQALVTKAAFFALIAPLLLYSEYLRRRDLRPAEESGSAKWNEDIHGYNSTYAEMTLAWPKAFHKFPLKLIRAPLIFLHKVLMKVPLINFFYKAIYKAIIKRVGHVDRTPGSKNMIYTDEICMSMNTRKTRRNNNVLVIGGSGTGKSRFMVKPNLLQGNCSYVITDPSGELIESMGKTLEKMGYEVRLFNLVQMEHSCCYNPFHYIRDQNGVLIMINSLIKNTTPKGASSNDPFGKRRKLHSYRLAAFTW